MTETARVYTPTDVPRDTTVYVDGREVHDAFAVCPAEGWVDVYEHEDGNNFTYATGVKLKVKRKGESPELATKRIHGAIRVVTDRGKEYT